MRTTLPCGTHSSTACSTASTPRSTLRPVARRLALPALALAAACAALPASAELVIQLANGQTVKLPYKRAEVLRIDFTGEGVSLLPQAGNGSAAAPAPVPAMASPGGPGTPWVVNAQGAIYQRGDGSWQKVPGAARDIGVGADGTVWVIGTESAPGGRVLFRLGPQGWVKVDGGAERIAVGPDGQPWVVTNAGAILRRVGN